MKSYPSIPSSSGTNFSAFIAHVFDKLDGSNMRFAWDKKKGWYRYGTRNRLLDTTDPVFGGVLTLFKETIASPLEQIAVKRRWNHAIFFAEYWGPRSLAGEHHPDDEKCLTLIDAAIDRKGIIVPGDFRKLFEGKVATAKFLGIHNWTRGFVQRVREGDLEGITLEGVVGKSNRRLKMVRSKAKTQVWIDRVLEFKGEEQGLKIVNS